MPQVPGPRSRELTRLREQYVARGVDEQHPVFVASTQGATLVDVDGNRDFGPLAPDVYRCPFPYLYRSGFASEPETVAACLDAFRGLVEEVGADRLAAAILEPVQGEGGFVVPPAAFVQGVAAYCRERGILLIADEIQTGFYRTGRRFGVEHFDVTPDLMALAK